MTMNARVARELVGSIVDLDGEFVEISAVRRDGTGWVVELSNGARLTPDELL